MCGIVVTVSPRRGLRRKVEEALEALRHRGPDGVGVWSPPAGGVVLGHRRLAVRGEFSDVQPIVNETGDIAICVNGEFYGAADERRRLEAAGHHFSTGSDSEIAVHLYEERGVDFLRFLRGEFALTLWDERKKRLVAARDRFGVKPLHYCHDGVELTLASEAKALFAAGACVPEWDDDSVWHSLAHQYLPPGRSLFRGVHSIPPAHCLIADAGAAPRLETYWKPSFEERTVSPDEVRARLQEAVRLRLEARISPAFSLSGGIDSSAVIALAERAGASSLSAFTVSFCDAAEFDESGAVESLMKESGIRRETIPVSRLAMVSELSDAVWFSEGLAINGQMVGKYLLSRAIRAAGHNVVISGEGADEVFLGYAHLQADAGGIDMNGGVARQRGIMLPHVQEAPEQFPEAPGWLGRWPTFMQVKMGFQRQYMPLLRDEAIPRFAPEERVRDLLCSIATATQLPKAIAFPKKAAWLWTRTALAGYILRTLGDGTEMAHSVEGRPPFLDSELFDTAFAAPVSRNLERGRSKALLRDALVGVVPERLRERGKHPFIAPPLLADGGSKEVVDFISDMLGSKVFECGRFFDPKRTRSWFHGLLRSDAACRASADPALMTILSMILAQKRFGL